MYKQFSGESLWQGSKTYGFTDDENEGQVEGSWDWWEVWLTECHISPWSGKVTTEQQPLATTD